MVIYFFFFWKMIPLISLPFHPGTNARHVASSRAAGSDDVALLRKKRPPLTSFPSSSVTTYRSKIFKVIQACLWSPPFEILFSRTTWIYIFANAVRPSIFVLLWSMAWFQSGAKFLLLRAEVKAPFSELFFEFISVGGFGGKAGDCMHPSTVH